MQRKLDLVSPHIHVARSMHAHSMQPPRGGRRSVPARGQGWKGPDGYKRPHCGGVEERVGLQIQLLSVNGREPMESRSQNTKPSCSLRGVCVDTSSQPARGSGIGITPPPLHQRFSNASKPVSSSTFQEMKSLASS